MSFQYKKTSQDKQREVSDLEHSPIMRFLQHQDYFKFQMGDIVVKQSRIRKDAEWVTETIRGNGAPKKFAYVFENKLGIGYIKQLRVDGSGFTTNLICVANFDPDYTRFILDPEFATHKLIGEDEFVANEEYLAKKKYKEEAIKKNKEFLVKVKNPQKRTEWFDSLKVGDKFWYGQDYASMQNNEYTVTKINDIHKDHWTPYVRGRLSNVSKYTSIYRTITATRTSKQGDTFLTQNGISFESDHFTWQKVSKQEPLPLSDPLCGQQR